MKTDEETPLSPTVPIPAPYDRQISYRVAEHERYDPNIYRTDTKQDSIQLSAWDNDSIKDDVDKEGNRTIGKRQMSVLIFLQSSRIWIRALAILIMITSFSLILAAVIMFAKAQNHPGHPLDQIPKPAKITDQPCITFTGIAAMNLILSIAILTLSCVSSKFNKSNNAVNAIFAIISAVGFASSMGACFYLNKETTLQNDLWKWSCGNHEHGLASEALDFNLVCNAISYGWKFGLVQASLELLTFIISIVAFILLKYSYFARFGRLGKLF